MNFIQFSFIYMFHLFIICQFTLTAFSVCFICVHNLTVGCKFGSFFPIVCGNTERPSRTTNALQIMFDWKNNIKQWKVSNMGERSRNILYWLFLAWRATSSNTVDNQILIVAAPLWTFLLSFELIRKITGRLINQIRPTAAAPTTWIR